MAKFTRTVYAASAREVAEAIASQASLYDLGPHCPKLSSPPVSARKADGYPKRIRITILVEPVAAPPKRPRGPKRAKPVQQALPLPEPELHHQGRLPAGAKYRMPLFGADGGST